MEARSRVLIAAALAALAVGLAPSRVWAEACEGIAGGVLETFPAQGARNTPRNGLALVIYCPPEDPLVDRSAARLLEDLGAAGAGCVCGGGAECLAVSGAAHCLAEVPTRVTVDGDVVRLETTGGDLAARTGYVIEAREPSAVARIPFETSDGNDQDAPVFVGPDRLSLIGCGVDYPANPACPDDDEGMVVVLSAPAASDEAGRVNLEYVAYLVTDDGLSEQGRTRGDGAADVTMSFFVPLEDVPSNDDRICFRMGARDPYGHETVADERVCEFTPDYSPFGSLLCAAAPARPGLVPAAALLLAALALGAALRRRG